VTTYSYNVLGQLAGVAHPDATSIGFSRDVNGNLLALTSPSATVNYGYDAANRLVQITSPEGSGNLAYDLAGNRVRATAPNGVVTDYAYDARGRLTSLVHKQGGSGVLQSFVNTYSPSGRRTQVTESDGTVEVFAYDGRNRLTSETRTGSNPYTASHAYDTVGNRVQQVRSGAPVAFVYDNNDRLLSDGTSTFAYDANGNLVSRTTGAVVTQYGYVADNRLITILGGGLANQYVYDVDGNRVQETTAQGTTRFLVDSVNNTGLAQVLEERDGAGNFKARFVYGQELALMSRGGATSHVQHDARGSTRLLTDAAGVATDRYVYDAYGASVAATGVTTNPYRYGGQRLDADSGLYQLRARCYSPSQGRFVSRDPFAGELAVPISLHRYLYADADPVNKSDPTGLNVSLGETMVAQYLNNIVDLANLTRTVGKACAAYSTTEQIQDLIFASSAFVHVVGAAAILQKEYQSGNIKKASFGGKGELNLLSLENPRAKPQSIKRIAISLTGGGGRVGIKASLDTAGGGSVEGASGTYDFEFTGPPPTLKGSAGGKVKAYEKKFEVCGVEGGSVSTELNLKGYAGTGAAGAGVSSELALKFQLFNGRFGTSFPLLGADWNGGKGTMGISVMGLSVAFGL